MNTHVGRIADEPGKFIKFFNYNPASTAIWTAGEAHGLEQRELGVFPASLGDMGARLIRTASARQEPLDLSGRGYDLRFLYVVDGGVVLDTSEGAVELAKDDALSVGAGQNASITRTSAGFTALELWLKAGSETRSSDNGPAIHLARLTPDSFESGNNLRRFFAYRNLGTDKLTNGRVYAQAIKTLDTPDGGTGWHYHSMSQFAFGLTGSAIVDFDGQASVTIGPGDGVSIPRHCKHNLSSLTQDYSLIEVCLPGKYDTIAIDPPAKPG